MTEIDTSAEASGEPHNVHLAAAALRYLLLSAHYRQPIEAGPQAIAAATKAVRRLLLAATPTASLPPVEIVQSLSDDLNTPKALALCHAYRKAGEGEKLFAALRFLGFMDCCSTAMGEPKTVPVDHLPAHEVMGGMHTAKNPQA